MSRKGNKKKQKGDENSIGIYELLDGGKFSLPIFVATDLNQVPMVKVTYADVCSLVVQMDNLKSSIDDMRVQLSQFVTMKTGNEYKEKAMSKVHEEQNMKKKDETTVKKIAIKRKYQPMLSRSGMIQSQDGLR